MLYSKTKNKAVVAIDSGNELAEVKAIIVDHDNGKFLGLVLKNKTVVYADDITEFGKDAVMVRSEKELMPLKDNEKFKELMDAKTRIKGNKVVTQSGEELGEVKDYEVDENTAMLKNISVSTGFIKDIFKGELVISNDQIIAIGEDAIIVKDAVVPVTKGAQVKKEIKDLAGAGVLNKELE